MGEEYYGYTDAQVNINKERMLILIYHLSDEIVEYLKDGGLNTDVINSNVEPQNIDITDLKIT